MKEFLSVIAYLALITIICYWLFYPKKVYLYDYQVAISYKYENEEEEYQLIHEIHEKFRSKNINLELTGTLGYTNNFILTERFYSEGGGFLTSREESLILTPNRKVIVTNLNYKKLLTEE